MSGVIALSAICVQSQPARTRAATTSVPPTSAAIWHALTPRLSVIVVSAPASISFSTTLTLPWPAAAISAVNPSYLYSGRGGERAEF